MGFFDGIKENFEKGKQKTWFDDIKDNENVSSKKQRPNTLHTIEALTDSFGDPDLDKVFEGQAPKLVGMIEDIYAGQAVNQKYFELQGRYNELRKHYEELQKQNQELLQIVKNLGKQ